MSRAEDTRKDVPRIATVPLPSRLSPALRGCTARAETQQRNAVGATAACFFVMNSAEGLKCWFSALVAFYVPENAF